MVLVLTALRLIHIFAGVFWAGTSIALAGFVEPAIHAAGPAGQTFNQRLWQHTRLLFFMNISAISCSLAGLVLFWIVSGGNLIAYVSTSTGLAFTLGSIAGLLEFMNGILVMAPTAAKIGALGAQMQTAGGPPTQLQLAQMSSLQLRLGRGGQYGASLLALAVIGMAIARYI